MKWTLVIELLSVVSLPTFALTDIGCLEPRNIIQDHVTLSGFCSMAQMMQIAYSSFFQGVGVFSSSYYRCGMPNGVVDDYNSICTSLSETKEDKLYDPELVHKDIEEYFAVGVIENLTNLRNKWFYVYTGLRSQVFSLPQSLNILKVWEKYIKNPYKVKTRVQDAGFLIPTDNHYGESCTSSSASNKSLSSDHFIGNCGFSGAFEALKVLHADYFQIHHPPSRHRQAQIQSWKPFNQSVFLEGLTNHQMDEVGFYYVPSRCQIRNYPCLLHIFFHGCGNNRKISGANFIGNGGFLEVAEVNDIVMLFPQSNSEKLKDGPRKGFWDVFGLGGDLYATKKGQQIQAIWRMVQGIMKLPAVVPSRPKPQKISRP